MKSLKPKVLKQGDCIGFLSLSGNIEDYSKVINAKNYFENLGYKVVVSDTTKNNDFYLCDTDENRAKALNSFFKNPEIKMILATRGGYGAIRILDKIDYNLVKNNPKIFVGYSDITAILWQLYKNTGLISFHGANAINTFSDNLNQFNENAFWNIFSHKQKSFTSEQNQTFYSGKIQAKLLGGNLSTINSLAGSDFCLDEKFILYLEDINEPVYKIDKMITQLLNIKAFKNNLSGLILGDFSGIDNEMYFEKYLNNLANDLKIPMSKGFNISHGENRLILPFGIEAEFDADKGEINISEDYFA